MIDQEYEDLKKQTLNQCVKDVMNLISKFELENLDDSIRTLVIEAWQAGAKAGMELYR